MREKQEKQLLKSTTYLQYSQLVDLGIGYILCLNYCQISLDLEETISQLKVKDLTFSPQRLNLRSVNVFLQIRFVYET